MKDSAIAMHPVVSSNIESIGYDAGSQTLAVKFKGDRPPYHYSGVPPDAHADLMASPSPGSHHAKNIKGKFSHVIAETDGGAP